VSAEDAAAPEVVLGTPGTWTQTFDVDVSVPQAIAYAKATNESDRRFLSGEIASPMFATVPVRPATLAAFSLAMPEGLPPTVPRLAGEQDMHFDAPIVPGHPVRCRARFLGISPKSSGTALVFEVETRDGAGGLLNRQYMTTFLPRVRWPREEGERPPDHAVPSAVGAHPEVARITQRLDADQTFRYAEASGDPSRWHLDDAVARGAGLPGIIIHGLCTMAFLGRALAECVAGGDVLRLRRLAVRFSRPIFPGSTMTTDIWAGDAREGRRALVFEATREDGERVITNGLAEVG
jgi:acyl dehydratase